MKCCGMVSKYSVSVDSSRKVVEVRFASTANFDLVEEILKGLKQYIAEDYQIKFIGYINRECHYLRAFMLALSLFGHENRIVFENKARYSKSDRRKCKVLVKELRMKGYSAKQISENLNIPLKTIYRWLSE